MHIYASKAPQERLALRKAEKIAQSEMFSYYIEEAKKLTETEIKKTEYRRYVSESGVRNDLTDMLRDRYIDEIFENGGLFSGLSFNANFLNYLKLNESKSGEDDLLNVVPDKWLSFWTGESPVKKAVQFLSARGIDAEKREPSHSLTNEQKKWLRSRHDLNAIYNNTADSLETYNFRADLVYLGVISPSEAESIGTVALPAHCAVKGGILTDTVDNSNANYLDGLRGILSKQKAIVEEIREKYNDPLRRQSEDLRFIENEKRHIAFQELYISMMSDLFG